MSDKFHRNACAKQHHIIGHYLAVQAWLRGLDCIVLDRVDLEFFFGLKRFKSARVRWLKDDLLPWFPFQEDYYRTSAPSSIHSLFLARVAISTFLPPGSMRTDQRIERMATGSPKTALFFDSEWLKERPSEGDMISQLSLLAAGIATPDQFRPQTAPPPRARPAPSFIDPFDIFAGVFPVQKEPR
ncbi:MAG: hypothetical protein DME97_05035 [Verrucomicrobia bacterium]|nr:MAG: hypothetical protein DME97_05035 [Verrucomicrobiota bacterium]